MSPNYKCPNCDSRLIDSDDVDYECVRCGSLIEEDSHTLKVDREPDRHGSRVYVYELNHVVEGQDHE